MKKQSFLTWRRLVTILLSGCLALALMTVPSVSAAEADPPAAFTAEAAKHIPQHLRITLHGVEQREGYSVVTGTALWDDDPAVSECEFNPAVLVGSSYYRPKCTAWTLVKHGDNTKEMEENTPADSVYSPVYTVENGTCRKDFEIHLLEDGQEIEVDELYANGVLMGSKLRFNMTSLVKTDDFYGESPASDDVELTLTEDVFGKTFPEGGSGSQSGDGTCRWCGQVHEGFFGSIQGFFHRILYFFAHLFD